MNPPTEREVREATVVGARLDRLPPTRYVWKLLLLLSLGGCFEFYDLFLMTYIGPGLVRSGFFTIGTARLFGLMGLASFVSATFAGLFLGTIAFGFAADRFGRRAIFTYSLLWYTVGSVVMALQTTATGILVWRMITGVGIGVELVTIDTYVAELMPREIRGRAFAVNQIVQFATIPFVALVSWLLVPRRPLGIDGWRWVVLIGSVSAVFVWFIRRSIPESPRWLASRGRVPEAEAVLRTMEEKVQEKLGSEISTPGAAITVKPARGADFLQIFRPPYLRRTIMLLVFHFFQTVGYYGFASWVPTLLIAAGIRTTTSLEYSFIIAVFAPIGPLLAYKIADRFERKWQMVWSSVCIGAFGLLFPANRTSGWLIVFGVLLTCSNNWMSMAFHAYQAELFPTEIRAQAVGFVYSWSRFSAIFTSLMIGLFLAHFGVSGVFAFIAASMLVIVFAVSIFGPRTRGLALESISR
jgi:MFS transporter, putative metabolite:H+ symporter